MSADERLLAAARAEDLAGVHSALGEGADVNAKAEFGDTALNIACQNGGLDIALALIEAGAAIENLGGADLTPLMNAAFGGHVTLVRLLLDKGAKINDDLLMSLGQKVAILEENAEDGMVRAEAVEAWRGFRDFLIAERQRQDAA
jgi:ankyrin repeat protein